jgi:hypothetical protein
VFKVARHSGFVQFVQRYRVFEGERAGLGPPQHGDMTDGAEGERDVAREAADVRALGDVGGEGGFT